MDSLLYNELKKIVFDEIDLHAAEVIALSDNLADNPEVSGKEYESSKKITALLSAHGFKVTQPFCGMDTAFIGRLEPDVSYSHKIAVMAEYDALPGIGHACGHCASGALSVLAVLGLSKIQNRLDASVDIVGTPDEECKGGKCKMAMDGVFDSYDIATMIHMGDVNQCGIKLLAMDSFRYTFHGQPTHASATPWEGRNALNAVQLMFHATDMLRQHVKPDVRIHGIIDYGGDAPNIVPHRASCEFFIRAADRSYLNEVIRLVDDCARGAAIATQTTFEQEATSYPFDHMKYNETGTAALAEAFKEMGLMLHPEDDLMGSSDVGNVSLRCPTFHPTIAITDTPLNSHTVEFAQMIKQEGTHSAIVNGAKIISLQMLKLFLDEDRLNELKQDFAEK